jgi:hypothetical protein
MNSKILLLCKTVFPLIIIFIVSSLDAQSVNYKWTKQIGDAASTIDVRSSAVDAAGNIYTVGWFNGSQDFDPGIGVYTLAAIGSFDIFVCKINPSGNLVWAKQMGGMYSTSRGYGIALDSFANVYTTGSFDVESDFDPGTSVYMLTPSGYNDIFISKLDSSGNFKWAKQIGGTSDETGFAITTDALGNVYSTGAFKGTVDFDPGTGSYNLTSKSVSSNDIYVSKLDSTGTFIWAKSMGGTSNGTGRSIAVDNCGNVYTTGAFAGTTDFDPGSNVYNLASTGQYDVFVSKLDSSGNFVWAKRWGSNNFDFGLSIAVDVPKNVYTTGYFSGTVDFDPGAGTYNMSTMYSSNFISKLDSSGNFVFAKTFAGIANAGFCFGNSIALDSSGNIYTTGSLYGPVDFDPGIGSFVLTGAGNNDIFVSKLNNSGNFVWAKAMGGTSDEQGRCIALSSTGDVYTCGYFNGKVDFDPGVGIDTLSSSGTSIFIHKMSPCVSSSTSITNTYCDSVFINGVKYTSSGIYTVVLPNAVYCDSIITLNLTIKKSSVNSLTSISCDSLFINNQTYKTSGIYIQILTNTAGCDSVLTLNVTIKKSSSRSISATVCKSYTLNGQNYLTSGTYTQIVTNAAGCDSVITLNLIIKDSYHTIHASACSSYTLNGQTYVTSGVYTQTFLNAVGCDSILTLDVTINKASVSSLYITACGYYYLNGQTYIASGVYSQTILSAGGCDSVITLNLSIKNSSVSSLTATACNSYTVNNITYTTSGVYTQTKTNTIGCDSVITLNLTINKNTTSTITTSGCKTYILNNQTYTSTGTYTQNRLNALGCDSIIILNLIIINVDNSVTRNGITLSSNAIGATYQWIDCNNNWMPITGNVSKDFTATVNGSYAVIITQNFCIDTSSCYSITNVGLTSGSMFNTIKVFPNPTFDKLTINGYPSGERVNFSLQNLLGQTILTGKLEDKQKEINISTIPGGIYYLEISEGETISRIKIIKN